ncbi:TIGR03790 family protein [Desulfobacter latus]|uniref:TIGR03790 family protein n=1 Tax=Desulfobacter latus TaxID=2292 RepID=A0A850T2W5_9BACT|nr:TIGR03790 family protein [Desulfobacter latus]NWH06073.1 TIGR03790 family protein [Desulfobacter latus]
MRFSIGIFAILFSLLRFSAMPALALSPDEVLVIANRNAARSPGLAAWYMAKRQIPKKNLLLVFITDKETCSRDAYLKKIVPRVRRALKKNRKINAIVTMYGLPLRISSPGMTNEEQARMDRLTAKKEMLNTLKEKNGQLTDEQKKALSQVNKKIKELKASTDKTASFDSELMLVKKDRYTLNFWLPNPFFLPWRSQKTAIGKSDVIMVSRLDGADPSIVKRIVNDGIEAETKGLSGTAYFDARWKDPGQKNVAGYGLYDKSIHNAASRLKKKGMTVILDDEQDLFQPGDCPNTALYCGWYSLANYVNAFTWEKGAVGYHIASSECATLKRKNSNVWCKKMLDNGIAATVGPVGEPYVQSFPMPEIFFDFLARGELTLVESYLVSLPYLSWKQVLVGDPLYRVKIKH